VSGLLDAYDRQRHLNWHERKYPDAPEWPLEPRDPAGAVRAISQYAGLSGVLEILLGHGLEVSFVKDPAGYIVLVEGDAVALSTGIGDTIAGALEAAVAGMDGAA
jgi:hypothetical protein